MIFSYLVLPFTYKIKQEPDQILVFFYVPSFIFIRTPEHYYKAIMMNVKSIRSKYKDRVKCYFLMVDCGNLSKINDERDYPVYCLRENNALNDMSDKADELFDIAYNKATKIIDKLDDNYLIENDVIPFIYQDKKDDGTGRVTVKYCKDSYEGTIVDFVVEKVG